MKGLAGLLLVAATAYADPVAPAKEGEPAPVVAPPPKVDDKGAQYSHDGQIGISIRTALGLRAIATYHDTDYCGQTSTSASSGNAPVCVGRAPTSVDLEMSYGLGKKLDVLAEIDLGAEQDFGSSSTVSNGPHVVRLSPGIRYFFSETAASKIFATAQVVFDFSDYKDITGMGRGNDFAVRNLTGYWLDLHHSYGIYAFVGETLGFARWLDFEAELGVGIQLRYP